MLLNMAVILLGIAIIIQYYLNKDSWYKIYRLEKNSKVDRGQIINLIKEVAKLRVDVKVLKRNKKENKK